MRHQSTLLFLALFPATIASAQPAPSNSLQQRFDAATAAYDKNDCAAALPLLDALATDPHVKPGSLPAAMIMAHRGACQVRTGQADTGEPLLVAGLAAMRPHATEVALDVADAENVLGTVAASRWDHDGALAHFDAALALQRDQARGGTLQRIALLTAFDGDNRAIDAANEGLRLEMAKPKPAKTMLAQWHMLLGRTLLNRGQIKAAKAELDTALDLSGGLRDQISAFDSGLRQDLAQAALLTKRTEDARRYMAYSGAGHAGGTNFGSAATMEAPDCGAETGLTPDDMAVVQLVISQSGDVLASETVYSVGNYAKASAFARAAANWRWKPEDAAKMPTFFRATARVELRCTRGDGGLAPNAPARDAILAWAHQAGLTLPAEKDAWSSWLKTAESARQSGNAAAELAARAILGDIDLRPEADELASIDRGLALAQDASLPLSVPPSVRNAARVLLVWDRATILKRRKLPSSAPARDDVEFPVLQALAAEPAIAADPLARNTSLLLALPRRRSGSGKAAASAILQRVASDSGLPDHHPLRQFALLQLANDAADKGRLDEAQRLFAETGLNQEQCALIGPKPALQAINDSFTAFPEEAAQWGFEGWVHSEYDILADGRTAGVRALASYPPFVFDQAAEKMLAGARYQASYRPQNGAACSANRETIRFALPDNAMVATEIKRKKKT
ncbi:energy transducer TonB [Novosphingobium sp. B-7]|uniref:energy transducer TonB n=1 Tax=Novosphingobium sp. B-7 TaxID=1298855 RepID=UPI000407FC7D|nr:energy transducer TonB [Novosphingobium sp. B-7]